MAYSIKAHRNFKVPLNYKAAQHQAKEKKDLMGIGTAKNLTEKIFFSQRNNLRFDTNFLVLSFQKMFLISLWLNLLSILVFCLSI